MNPEEFEALGQEFMKEQDLASLESEFNVPTKTVLPTKPKSDFKGVASFSPMDILKNTLAGGIASIRQVDKNKAGVEELFYEATGNKDALKELASQQKTRDAAYKGLSKNYPISTLVGTMAPYVATAPFGVSTNVAKTAAHKLPQTVSALKAITAGGLEGAASGAASYDDTIGSGAAWGAGGAGVGRFLGDAMGGATNKLLGPDRDTIEFAKKHKLFTPPGMRTGDQQLQQLDSAFKTSHRTISKYQKRLLESKMKENRLISKEIGGDVADVLSPDYLAGERKRIGKGMDDLVKGTTGNVTDDMALRATDIIENFKRVDIDETAPALLRTHERKLYELADSGGKLTGDQYEKVSKDLNAAISNQYGKGEVLKGSALNKLVDIYNDAIGKGVGTVNAKKWKELRKQYALVKSVEKAKDLTTQKGAAGVSGYVDASKLAKIFKSSDTINKLADVENLRKSQRSSTLATSDLLARMLKVNEPSQALGAFSLLGSRAKGKLPFVDEILASLYLSGFPHATGIAPILGGQTQGLMSNLGSRVTMPEFNQQ